VLGKNSQGTPRLQITKTHQGNFTKGQTNAKYTVTVTNPASSTGPSSGKVHRHRHHSIWLDFRFHGGHWMDLRLENLHGHRCFGGRQKLRGDYRDGERGGECALQSDEYDFGIRSNSPAATASDVTTIN
jgi:hypothetical protein